MRRQCDKALEKAYTGLTVSDGLEGRVLREVQREINRVEQ